MARGLTPVREVIFFLGFLLFLPLCILACGPTVELGNAARIVVLPRNTVSFARVEIGQSSEQKLVIKNIGDDELRVSRMDWEGSKAVTVHYEADGFPIRLLKNEEISLSFIFSPQQDSPSPEGILWVYSNDPDQPTLKIELLSQQMAPQIYVSPSSAETLIFGQSEIGQKLTRTVTISNVGDLNLDIREIVLRSTDEFSQIVSAGKVPSSLRPGTQDLIKLDLSFAPKSTGKKTARLEISSNDPKTPVYELPIVANSATPCLLIRPSILEFHQVSVGTEQTKRIELESCSAVPLLINQVQSQEGSSPFRYELVGGNTALALGEKASLDITYAPQTAGSHSNTYVISSNDPLASFAQVRVLATSTNNECPRAELRGRVSSASDWTRMILGAPLDTIALDGSLSSDKESNDLKYHFTVKSRPSDSTSRIVSEGKQASFFVDLAGKYEFCLAVEDSEALMSCNTDCITMDATPKQKLHIQLVWNTPKDPTIGDDDGTDLDLHFVRMEMGKWGDRGEASLNNGTDVYFLNQKPTWDIEGGSVEYPSLDRDDKDGEGPENVSLDNPNPCAWYAVGVHYYNDYGFGESYATLRIYINGKMRFEKSNISLKQTSVFREIALIHWDGSTARAFERDVQYQKDSDWIGVSPSIPNEIQEEAKISAPQCF